MGSKARRTWTCAGDQGSTEGREHVYSNLFWVLIKFQTGVNKQLLLGHPFFPHGNRACSSKYTPKSKPLSICLNQSNSTVILEGYIVLFRDWLIGGMMLSHTRQLCEGITKPTWQCLLRVPQTNQKPFKVSNPFGGHILFEINTRRLTATPQKVTNITRTMLGVPSFWKPHAHVTYFLAFALAFALLAALGFV